MSNEPAPLGEGISDELEPCPFCGEVAHLHENDWCEPSEWSAHCLGCGCSTGGCTTRDMAIAAWNRRLSSGRDRNATIEVTRPMIEFRAELREKREAEIRDLALEEAAKVAVEDYPVQARPDGYSPGIKGAIAARIRALKTPNGDKPPSPAGEQT